MTKQDVLDMLNLCDNYQVNPGESGNDACNNIGKTCIFMSGLNEGGFTAIEDCDTPYGLQEVQFVESMCCFATEEEQVELPLATTSSLSNGVLTCNWEYVEGDVYTCVDPKVDVYDLWNGQEYFNELNLELKSEELSIETVCSSWQSNVVLGSEIIEQQNTISVLASADDTEWGTVSSNSLQNKLSSVQCNFSENTVQVYYCCTSDCADGAYGNSECNGECTSAQNCECYGNGCPQ